MRRLGADSVTASSTSSQAEDCDSALAPQQISQSTYRLIIFAAPGCFARGVCRGIPRERLAIALGQPEEVEGNVWRYSDLSGYNEVSFTFDAAGAVDTMTWTAEAD